MRAARRRRRILERRRVVVSLTTGLAVRGVLWEHRGDIYVLKNAEILEQDRSPVPVDGDVVLDLALVELVQVLPPPATPAVHAAPAVRSVSA
jgi:hypothetical protein